LSCNLILFYFFPIFFSPKFPKKETFMFGQKKDKEEKSKLGDTPKSPSIVRSGAKLDKWKVEEQRKADKMAKKALEEEEDSFSLPLAVRQLEPKRAGYRLRGQRPGGWSSNWSSTASQSSWSL